MYYQNVCFAFVCFWLVSYISPLYCYGLTYNFFKVLLPKQDNALRAKTQDKNMNNIEKRKKKKKKDAS